MASYLSYEPEPNGITPAVRAVLVANVVVLFLQWTLVQDAQMFAWLGFRAARIGSTWWSPVTYMFVHQGLLHLALNCYMLWLFGPRLEAAMGTRRFSLFYLWSGLGGVALHWMLSPDSVLVGASAAVYGVMLGYAMTWPHDEVMLFGVIPMRVIVMVMLLTAINLLSGLADRAGGMAGGVGYFAHLGGFAFAFLWMRMPTGAALDRLRGRVAPAPDIPTDEPPRAIPRTVRRQEPLDPADEVVRRSRAVVGPRRATPRAQRSVAEPDHTELDRVLDKISATGIESLTSAERKVLDESARKLRGD